MTRRSSPLRVLHCIPSVAGGGAERQLVYLVAETVRAGHAAHVALLRRGPHFDVLSATAAVIHPIPHRGNHDPLIMVRLARLIRRVRPDIVQSWLTQMDVFGGLAALLNRVPWILSERTSEVAYPATFKNRLRSAVAQRAAAIVSNSEGGDAYWSSRANPRTLRRVIRNAVPLERTAGAQPVDPAAYGLDGGRPLVLYVGRFSEEKNLDALVDALAIVLARSDAAVALCGVGPSWERFRHRLAAFPPGRVAMPGFVGDVWSWHAVASVLVNVGFFEGNPNSVIEAMAAGTPLVVSDIPAHREILDAESAIFVDLASPEAIAAGILRALREREAAGAMAANARRHAEAWSVPVIARQYAGVYEEVLRR
jgi:glycosyltransferase involved in cell wall biosynthesis